MSKKLAKFRHLLSACVASGAAWSDAEANAPSSDAIADSNRSRVLRASHYAIRSNSLSTLPASNCKERAITLRHDGRSRRWLCRPHAES